MAREVTMELDAAEVGGALVVEGRPGVPFMSGHQEARSKRAAASERWWRRRAGGDDFGLFETRDASMEWLVGS